MKQKTKLKFNLIIILMITLFAIATIPKTLQEDTYYMIKVGEYISANGMQVIQERIEPFSWLDGMKYTYPHWLLDIIFYLIYNAFDFLGIYIFVLIIGILTYMLIYYTNIKVGKNNILSSIITIASIYLMQGFITARAQIITYICCILTVLFIERFLETRKKRYLVGLFLVPILLANCHAALFPIYFVIYLPYIGEYIISYLTKEERYKIKIKLKEKTIKISNKKIEKKKTTNKETKNANKINNEKLTLKIKRQEEKLKKKNQKLKELQSKLQTIKNEEKTKQRKIVIKREENMKWLLIIFIICIFTGLLTPLKDIPYTYMIKSIKGNTMNFISEHQAVDLIHTIPTLAIMLITVTLLFSNKIKIRLQDVFMLLGMTILALISYKQFPIFLICTMTIINKLSVQVIPNKIKEKTTKLIDKLLSIKGMIYITLITVAISLWQYKKIAVQNFVDSNEYPVQATKWLKDNYKIDKTKMKLFNDFNYGSYLLFNNIPVFIDGRADAYDPVFNEREEDSFLDYMQTSSLQVWYEDTFKKYEITHIITKTNSNFNIFLQRNIQYNKLYDDGTFTIYERLEDM